MPSAACAARRNEPGCPLYLAQQASLAKAAEALKTAAGIIGAAAPRSRDRGTAVQRRGARETGQLRTQLVTSQVKETPRDITFRHGTAGHSLNS